MNSAPPPPYQEKATYQQAPPPMAQPVFISSPLLHLSEYPVQCTCPTCHQQIVTRIEKKTGLLAWLICLGLIFFGMWLCCCIPFCVDACKDTEHFCPSCNTMLGVSKKI